MPRIERETRVRAPPEHVFLLLTEPAQRARWLTSMRDVAVPTPLTVGSRIEARRTATGSRSTYELTVTRLENGRAIETDVRRNGTPAGRAGYEVSTANDGSLVRAFGEFELHGLQRMLTPVVTASMEKEIENDLAALKKAAEAPTP